MKVEFTKFYWEKARRLLNLKILGQRILLSGTKRMALQFIREFHDGIKNNSLNLKKLDKTTIQRKAGAGMERPESPLYGKGDEKEKNSYCNMLRILSLKTGHKVYISRGMHWGKRISLKSLFQVHEHGTIIENGFGKGILIRIPPRPAFFRAYRKTLKKKSPLSAPRTRRALAEYVNNGKDRLIKSEIKRLSKGYEKEAKRGEGE